MIPRPGLIFKIFAAIFEFRDSTLHRAFATECQLYNLVAFSRGDQEDKIKIKAKLGESNQELKIDSKPIKKELMKK